MWQKFDAATILFPRRSGPSLRQVHYYQSILCTHANSVQLRAPPPKSGYDDSNLTARRSHLGELGVYATDYQMQDSTECFSMLSRWPFVAVNNSAPSSGKVVVNLMVQFHKACAQLCNDESVQHSFSVSRPTLYFCSSHSIADTFHTALRAYPGIFSIKVLYSGNNMAASVADTYILKDLDALRKYIDNLPKIPGLQQVMDTYQNTQLYSRD